MAASQGSQRRRDARVCVRLRRRGVGMVRLGVQQHIPARAAHALVERRQAWRRRSLATLLVCAPPLVGLLWCRSCGSFSRCVHLVCATRACCAFLLLGAAWRRLCLRGGRLLFRGCHGRSLSFIVGANAGSTPPGSLRELDWLLVRCALRLLHVRIRIRSEGGLRTICYRIAHLHVVRWLFRLQRRCLRVLRHCGSTGVEAARTRKRCTGGAELRRCRQPAHEAAGMTLRAHEVLVRSRRCRRLSVSAGPATAARQNSRNTRVVAVRPGSSGVAQRLQKERLNDGSLEAICCQLAYA
jgi:hypothetical protein